MLGIANQTHASLALLAAGLAAALAVAPPGAGRAQDKSPAPKRDAEGKSARTPVMQRKLAQAQKLLEGLALADFGKIDKATAELIQVRADASWTAVKTPRYALLSDEFLRHLESIQRASKDKNVDGVALAYVELTLNCVKCHQHVRDRGMGRAPVALEGFAARPATR